MRLKGKRVAADAAAGCRKKTSLLQIPPELKAIQFKPGHDLDSFVQSIKRMCEWIAEEEGSSKPSKLTANNRMLEYYIAPLDGKIDDSATRLILSGLELTSLPKEIGNLTKLIKLDLSNNQLTSLPTEIGNLTNLTYLSLKNNQLTSLPREIGGVTNLTYLSLENNQLTSLPKEIGELTNLTRLDLCYNNLTGLPAGIGNLTNLTELWLETNQYTSVPAPLTIVPAEIWPLTNLTLLYIEYNGLTSLSPEIGNLTNLSWLRLAHNKLTSLPDEIWALANLRGLDFDENQLTSLPEGVGNLTNLTELKLQENKLISLPEEMGNLTKLTTLWLNDNQLTELPNLRGLKGLHPWDEGLDEGGIFDDNHLLDSALANLPPSFQADGLSAQKGQGGWRADYNDCVAKITSITAKIQNAETHRQANAEVVQNALGIYFNGVDLPNDVEYHIIAQLKDKREAVRLTCKSARDYSNFLELEALNDQQRELMRVKEHLKGIAEKNVWTIPE